MHPTWMANTFGCIDPISARGFGRAGYTRPFRARTVRTRQAALTLFGNGRGMLFDLEADPEERTNLFGRADSGRLERDLRELLIELEWQRFDPLPRRNKHPTAMH